MICRTTTDYFSSKSGCKQTTVEEDISGLFVNIVISPALSAIAIAGPTICIQLSFAKPLIARLFTDRAWV
jgi:hypothetical protein